MMPTKIQIFSKSPLEFNSAGLRSEFVEEVLHVPR